MSVRIRMLTQSFKRYLRAYLLLGSNELQITFVDRSSNLLFLLGKAIRFGIMLVFLIALKNQLRVIGGYTANQVLVFYITYQLIDTLSQILYRGVYSFGPLIRNGNFDMLLAKPINPLFRVLTGEPDFNDLVFLGPFLLASAWLLHGAGVVVTLPSFLLYLGLLGLSMVIATAFHIVILALTMISVDSDNNLIFLYRDLSRMGQFPVTIYSELIRLILFFVVPVGLMITIPAQVLIDTQPTVSLGVTAILAGGFFWASLRIWNWALRQYSSASS